MTIFWLIIIFLTLLGLAFILMPLLGILPRSSQAIRSWKFALPILVLFPAMTIPLYLHWGNSQQLAEFLSVQKNAAIVRAEIQKYGSRQKIISTLETKLNQLPEDKKSARGWYLLGKLYLSNQDNQKAIYAMEKANRLDPNNTEIMLHLAAIKFITNHYHLDADTKTLLQQVLQNSPINGDALNLLAMDAFKNARYEEAIRYWEILLPQVPVNSSEAKTLLAMINEAENKLSSDHIKKTVSEVKLSITVRVKPSLQKKINPGDTVFIYAVPDQGSQIPLAVTKRQAKELPVALVLSDKDAMLNNHSLSKATRIKVIARISKSGSATPAPGDFIGESRILNTSHLPAIEIEINKIL